MKPLGEEARREIFGITSALTTMIYELDHLTANQAEIALNTLLAFVRTKQMEEMREGFAATPMNSVGMASPMADLPNCVSMPFMSSTVTTSTRPVVDVITGRE